MRLKILAIIALSLFLLACKAKVPEPVEAPPVEEVVKPEPVEAPPVEEAAPAIEEPPAPKVEEKKPEPSPEPVAEEVKEEKLVEGIILRSGKFRTQYAPGIAPTFGTAQIVKDGNAHYLQLKGFSTGEAKQLHVYLAVSHQITSAGDYQIGYMDVGELKKLKGDQQYRMPDDFEPRRWGSVSIFSKYNSAVHAYADLQ